MKKEKNVYNEQCDLPYERFLQKGSQSLSDLEVLAILIQTGSRTKNVLEIAELVLQRLRVYGPGLTGLSRIELSELKQIEGIGNVKAIKLKTVAEISSRIWQTNAYERLYFNSPKSIADYYRETLRHEMVEKVIVIMFDTKMGYLGEKLLTQGTVDASLVSPRELFIYALQMQAVHMIMLHNHPSGDVTASKQDVDITNRISELGKMMSIDLVDHIIIGDTRFFSFKEHGLIL